MPKDDIAPAEARKLVDDHERRHGHDMKPTPADEQRGVGHHDVPSQAELDAEPDWHKHGKKLGDLPDGDS